MERETRALIAPHGRGAEGPAAPGLVDALVPQRSERQGLLFVLTDGQSKNT